MTSGPDIDVLTKADGERNFPTKFQTIPKTFRIWDGLHKRWFQGGTDAKRRELGTDAIHFFGELMMAGEVFQDQNEDAAWRGVGYVEKLNYLTCVQSTGLRDKNGREIFEGDIVRSPEGALPRLEVVEYEVRAGYARIKPFYPESDDDLSPTADETEIVGNIFENPELLEEER